MKEGERCCKTGDRSVSEKLCRKKTIEKRSCFGTFYAKNRINCVKFSDTL